MLSIGVRKRRPTIPRKRNERPSRPQREERIRRERANDPFNGDTEALKAEIDRRLLRHARILGYDELCRRLRARGLEPPPRLIHDD